jgi:hypothetical protein
MLSIVLKNDLPLTRGKNNVPHLKKPGLTTKSMVGRSFILAPLWFSFLPIERIDAMPPLSGRFAHKIPELRIADNPTTGSHFVPHIAVPLRFSFFWPSYGRVR